jgi:hypothetical protein
VDPGQVSAETRRTCVTIAVIGSVLILAGATAGVATQFVSSGLPGVAVVAWGLVAGGWFCGVVLIAASGSPARGSPGRGSRRWRTAAPAGTTGQPGTSEEWIRGLRPGPGGKPE